VNTVDVPGLESREAISRRLKNGGTALHVFEVKGPGMDRLRRSRFLNELTGRGHLSQFEVMRSINAELAQRILEAQRP